MRRDVTVPLLDLRAQYATIKPEIDEAIARVVESQVFILGPQVSGLEEEMAGLLGCRHAIGCASGSDAILLALMALGVGAGDQVLCPAYTFFATAGSVARLGAVPVFADIDPATYNMDPDSARYAASRCDRLAAIMPVHLFGQAADLDAFLELGAELRVPVVEDAAQALGTRDGRGRRVGTCGRVSCFSFFPTKNLGGYGDGGLLTTDDDELAGRLRSLRVHGAQRRYYHDHVGLNSRLDALQAAVLRVKLRHLERWNEGRRANADWYDRAFAAAEGAAELELHTPQPAPPPAVHIYNQYVIRVAAGARDGLREHLTQRGIGSEIYYPVPLHLQKCFRYLGHHEGDLPHSESAARETLALPVYAELTQEQRRHVVDSIVEYAGRGSVASPGGMGQRS